MALSETTMLVYQYMSTHTSWQPVWRIAGNIKMKEADVRAALKELWEYNTGRKNVMDLEWRGKKGASREFRLRLRRKKRNRKAGGMK